jgi:YegS/Rv2252/BmrU family lipid kinase
VETRAAGEALALAAAARRDGYKTLVAAGGDGTVNEVLNGLAQTTLPGEPIGRLALLPVGTGNDLADMLGFPRNLDSAAAHLAAGRTRRIDVGLARMHSPATALERYFGNNMGLGFEAQVTLESYQIQRLTGALRYLVAVFQALRRFATPYIELTWERSDGGWEQRAQRSLLVSVGNSARTGGLFYLTPDALLDDGLLDLGVARQVSRGRILLLLPKVLRGAHRGDPALELTRCRRLHFHCTETLPVHLDGEVVMRDLCRAEVEVQPRRLEVII